jgi:uncharacterized protein (DUF1778 family)
MARMLAMAKKTEKVNVRMTSEDLALLRKAAATLWPGVEITTSMIVLTLAKRAAEQILSPARERKAK